MEDFNLDEFLARLLSVRNWPWPWSCDVAINGSDITNLCGLAKPLFMAESTLLEVENPIYVCGDIHGQYIDLLRLLEVGGDPPLSKYLFLGDYVDRGPNSIEVVCLLLSLKVKYPQHVFLLRGNHEDKEINRTNGFRDECIRRFGRNYKELYRLMNRVFEWMPLAAVVDNQHFCCHGGLSPLLTNLQQIRDIERPIAHLKNGLPEDLTWSDPDTANTVATWERMNQPGKSNHRGRGYLFGPVALNQFLENTEMEMVFRAHQCQEDGFTIWGEKLVTIFSAPNYCGQQNYGAIALIEEGEMTIRTFR